MPIYSKMSSMLKQGAYLFKQNKEKQTKKSSLTAVEQTCIISMNYLKNFPIIQTPSLTPLLFLSQPSAAHSAVSFTLIRRQIAEPQMSVIRKSFHRSFDLFFSCNSLLQIPNNLAEDINVTKLFGFFFLTWKKNGHIIRTKQRYAKQIMLISTQ